MSCVRNGLACIVVPAPLWFAWSFYSRLGVEGSYRRPYEGELFWRSMDQRWTGRMFSASDVAFRCNVTFESTRSGVRVALRLDRFDDADVALLRKCRYTAIQSFARFLCSKYEDAVEVSVAVQEWVPNGVNETRELELLASSAQSIDMYVSASGTYLRWDKVIHRQNMCVPQRAV